MGDIDLVAGSIVVAVALILGVIAFAAVTRKLSTASANEARLEEIRTRNIELETALENKNEALLKAERELSTLRETVKQEREKAEEKLSLLSEAKETLTLQFRNLANDIFEAKGKTFTEKNQQSLANIIEPLKSQINDFKKKVEDQHTTHVTTSATLKVELERLSQLNEQLGEEAHSLTTALVGQSQTQGAWGEMILEKLLEQSGLEKGHHYVIQQSGTTEDGKRYRPDVVVRLPEGKDIIVDSKVSLTAYNNYCAETDPDAAKQHLKAHVASIRGHFKELADKNYYDLSELNSLEYVLMFVPIESAFGIASHEDHGLVTDALKRNVIIVTPTTLLLALRTIENLWRYEDQSQNAQEIATRAGQLYDKFVGFVSDIENVGRHIDKAHEAQENAIKKLSTGKGNLVGRAEHLRKLGVKTNKSLPSKLVTDETS